MTPAAVEVSDLSISYVSRVPAVRAVRGVDLSIPTGRCLGLVGESGSGKSTVGLALQGLLCADETVEGTGSVTIDGVRLDPFAESGWSGVRGAKVTTVFQDPMTSLDPLMSIGRMLDRVTGSRAESLDWLREVEIRDPTGAAGSFPHQLSGGMRQRVMIALALAKHPTLLIADEPTTALDVGVQAQILALLARESERLGCGVLFVTHDLGVARAMCDEIAVMRGGEIVERGAADDVFDRPAHPYTTRLVGSRITLATDRERPLGMPESTIAASLAEGGARDTAELLELWEARSLTWGEFDEAVPEPAEAPAPALSMRGVRKSFATGGMFSRSRVEVLHGIDLEVAARESVALVGESGSGKSTILRLAAGLEKADAGVVDAGDPSEVQVVFQDAGSSLTPWMTVERILTERLVNTAEGRRLGRAGRRARVTEALERVALPEAVAGSRPGHLSGGQRQRVAIARSIVVPPRILLCDEPTSALDVTVACTVLNLLNVLRHTLGLSLLFVTHDLAAARIIADRLLVIEGGRIVESVSSDRVTDEMTSPYGRSLLDAVLA